MMNSSWYETLRPCLIGSRKSPIRQIYRGTLRSLALVLLGCVGLLLDGMRYLLWRDAFVSLMQLNEKQRSTLLNKVEREGL